MFKRVINWSLCLIGWFLIIVWVLSNLNISNTDIKVDEVDENNDMETDVWNLLNVVNHYYGINNNEKTNNFDTNLYGKYINFDWIVSYDNYSKKLFIYFAWDKTSNEIKQLYINADNFDTHQQLTPYIAKISFDSKKEKLKYQLWDRVSVKWYIDTRGWRIDDVWWAWRWGIKDFKIIKKHEK